MQSKALCWLVERELRGLGLAWACVESGVVSGPSLPLSHTHLLSLLAQGPHHTTPQQRQAGRQADNERQTKAYRTLSTCPLKTVGTQYYITKQS